MIDMGRWEGSRGGRDAYGWRRMFRQERMGGKEGIGSWSLEPDWVLQG